MANKKISFGFSFFLLCAVSVDVRAACNDRNNWLQSPDPSIKAIVNYKPLAFNGNAEEDDPNAPKAFPVLLSREEIEKESIDKFDANGGSIAYFEPVRSAGWRLCRLDNWVSDKNLGNNPAKINSQKLSQQYRSSNTFVKEIAKGYWLSSSEIYFYDVRGRTEYVSYWDFEDAKSVPHAIDCRRYDDKDRLILLLKPEFSKVCPAGALDPRDSWQRYKYGDYKGERVVLLRQRHSGDVDSSWSEKSYPFRVAAYPDAPWGNAEADSKDGLTLILGSNLGKFDNNVANTVVDSYGRWTGSTYSFTKPPVPVSVLDNPDELYRYDRRRQTYVDGELVKLFEFFKANEHISRHRYYMIDGDVLRHEQLDEKGKVTRVITISDWRQPRPGTHPSVNDNLLSTHEMALITHQVFHRVYDIDATGKPNLVAVSWNRAVRLNLGKKVPIDLADLVYGTPDGKIRWKNKAEFEKVFNTSASAAHVFPDERKSLE